LNVIRTLSLSLTIINSQPTLEQKLYLVSAGTCYRRSCQEAVTVVKPRDDNNTVDQSESLQQAKNIEKCTSTSVLIVSQQLAVS